MVDVVVLIGALMVGAAIGFLVGGSSGDNKVRDAVDGVIEYYQSLLDQVQNAHDDLKNEYDDLKARFDKKKKSVKPAS